MSARQETEIFIEDSSSDEDEDETLNVAASVLSRIDSDAVAAADMTTKTTKTPFQLPQAKKITPDEAPTVVNKLWSNTSTTPNTTPEVAAACEPMDPLTCNTGATKNTDDMGSPCKKKRRLAPMFVQAAGSPSSSLPATTKQQQPPLSVSDEEEKKDDDMVQEESKPAAIEEEPTQGPATPDFLQSHCWDCHARVKATANEGRCLYSLHVHPILKVPVCSICCEVVESIDTEQQQEVDQCCGCGADDGAQLLLCDLCPHGYCLTCVAQAHGGGSAGLRHATALQDNGRSWACLSCNPPMALERLQIADESSSDDDTVSMTEAEKELKIVELIQQLDALEEELLECDKQDTPSSREEKRQECEQEFARLFMDDPLEATERVEQELKIHEHRWDDHHTRLEDSRTVFQEQLESLGVPTDKYYQYRKQLYEPEMDLEGDWKVAADKAVDDRLLKEKQHDECDDDSLSDTSADETGFEVEDLENDESCQIDSWQTDKVTEWRSGWGTSSKKRKRMERDLEKLLERDDELLKDKSIPVKRVRDEDDADAFRREERQCVSRGSQGIIRRDAVRVVRARSAKRARPSQQKNQSGSSKKPVGGSKKANPREQEGGLEAAEPQTAKNRLYGDIFDSSLVLSGPCSDKRAITVAKPLAEQLKEHQVEGVQFMFNTTFSHLAAAKKKEDVSAGPGGAILAHFMGLGKSIQTISLLHTLLNHPSLVTSTATRLVHKVLLIVPANTLSNWGNEFRKWTGDLSPSIDVFDLSTCKKDARYQVIKDWNHKGGVLLVSEALFKTIATKSDDLKSAFLDPGADVVVLDEGHLMVKNKNSVLYKALNSIRTKLRISLTGTPFANNLIEYFNMASWVRPGSLGTEKQFKANFVVPINAGMASDSTDALVSKQVRKTRELADIMSTFMQRKDQSTLEKSLPPMREIVLHLRQTKLQRKLYTTFGKLEKAATLASGKKMNLFTRMHLLQPVHSHPSCLARQMQSQKTLSKAKAKKAKARRARSASTVSQALARSSSPTVSQDIIELLSDEDPGDATDENEKAVPPIVKTEASATGKQQVAAADPPKNAGSKSSSRASSPSPSEECSEAIVNSDWWKTVEAKRGEESFNKLENGYKIIMLLQILAHADSLGEKTVVFSHSLISLDFIESVLESTDWGKHVRAKSLLGDTKLGGWKKGTDFLRFDGTTDSAERGELITNFNDTKGYKVFLISSFAGGIGINLASASRVVMYDSHWNPTVTSQAISRCWRYGQGMPVTAYRFLVEGTIEENIFARLVTKSGLAARVIDQKFPERNFTKQELQELAKTDIWACCDGCGKWRMLLFESDEEKERIAEEDDDNVWFCEMNRDPSHSKCSTPEHDTAWYSQHMSKLKQKFEKLEGDSQDASGPTSDGAARESLDLPHDSVSVEKTRKWIEEDAILNRLGVADILGGNQEKQSTSPNKKSKKKASFAKRHISNVRFPVLLLKDSKKDIDTEALDKKASDEAAALAATSTASQVVDGKLACKPNVRVDQVRNNDQSSKPEVGAIESSARGATQKGAGQQVPVAACGNHDGDSKKPSVASASEPTNGKTPRKTLAVAVKPENGVAQLKTPPPSGGFQLSKVNSSGLRGSSTKAKRALLKSSEKKTSSTGSKISASAEKPAAQASNAERPGADENNAIDLMSDSD